MKYFPLVFIIMAGLFLLLAILPIASGVLGEYEQGLSVQLIQTCNNCTYCNLTSIKYPNSSNIFNNVVMIENETEYSFDLSGIYTGTIGFYKYCYDCGNANEKKTGCIDFEITPTGYKQTTSQGIGSAMFLFLILALTFLFGYAGFKLVESDYLWVLGFLFLFLTILFIVYDVWLGYEFHRNWSGINDGSVMPEIIFYIFLFVLVSGLVVSGILLFTKWKKLVDWFKKGWREMKKEQANELNEKEWD